MTNQVWIFIFSSSVISGILSALILGAYNLRAKRNDYVNDYYKTVIARRVAAYEQLERLIVSLKIAVLDADRRPYHILFSKDDDWQSAYNLLSDMISHALWLSNEAFEKTKELNYLIYRLKPIDGAIEFGKVNYKAIAEIRSDLEKIAATDMLKLHDVKSFLKTKKKTVSGFHAVQLGS
jgi:hypothetical protein